MIISESDIPGSLVDVLQKAARTEASVASATIDLKLVAVRILDDTLLSLLSACPYPGLSLLGQANLILLRILRLRLGRGLCWGLGIAGGGILRHEPGYRE
jgi:hypothetical protein